jgi:hypothetical protein
VYDSEAMISPGKRYFQEHVVSRVFDLIHPVYLAMCARASRARAAR